MEINLHSRYDKKVAQVFRQQSILDGRLSSDYSFTGVKTVRVTTLQTVPLSDYKREGINRYGEPREMQDTVQELTVTQDKAFSMTIDKGNDADQQGIKAADRAMATELRDVVIPEKDRYCFQRLAMCAGKIVGGATALTKSNVCDRISDGTLFLDDSEVPAENRTLFVSNKTYKLLKHSDEFLGVDSVGEKALAKGQVGLYDNMPVVRVPKERFPQHVNFMIVYKNSAAAPTKISDTRLHQDPPGLSGNLLEGRFYYDLFVIGAKANGIYVEVDTAAGNGKIAKTPALTAAAGGAVTLPQDASMVKYTVDGSDPRYSASAKTITASTTAAVGEKGQTLCAVAFEDGAFPSEVAKTVLS